MSAIAFEALGGARPRFFLLLVQKKETKENDTRRLALCYRKGFPVLLALSGARELAIFDRSNMHALISGNGCDARRRQRDRGALICLRSTPSPLVQPSTAGQNREKRGLSERSTIASSAAPVLTEEHRGVEAKRRPSLGVPFLLPSFLWASKEKKGWCAEHSAFKITRASARNK